MHLIHSHTLIFTLVCALLTAMTFPATAQHRNPLQTIGETVADHSSAHYHFKRFTVSSADTTRTWRVRVGIPKREVPTTGAGPHCGSERKSC